MGRPPTREKKLKDGFYIEVRNKGSKSGIKIRRDDKRGMDLAIAEYEKSKEVIVLGESVNGKFLNDKKPKALRKKKAAKKKPKAAVKKEAPKKAEE